MEIYKTRTCERCKVQVPLPRVKLFARDNDRNWLVCEDCCEVLKSKVNRDGKMPLPPLKKEPIRNVYQPRKNSGPFRPKDLQPKSQTTPSAPKMVFREREEPVMEEVRVVPIIESPEEKVVEAKPGFFARLFSWKKKEVEQTPVTNIEEVPMMSEVRVEERAPEVAMPKRAETAYSCNRCNYKFKSTKNTVGAFYKPSCPYCGKGDRVQE